MSKKAKIILCAALVLLLFAFAAVHFVLLPEPVEGEKAIVFQVTGHEGTKNFDFRTNAETLADALMEKGNVTVHFSTVVTGYRSEDGLLKGLELRSDDGREFVLPVDGAFLAVGLSPENDAFAEHAELNQWGYFDSAEDCRTRTEGLFVAGDCRSKRIRQVVTAASDGAIAAMAACSYLDM